MKAKASETGDTTTPTEPVKIEPVTVKAIEATVAPVKQTVAEVAAVYEDNQVKAKQGMEKVMKTAEELVAFSQGNVEAIMKCSQIWATGVQDLSKHVAETAKATMEESMNTFKALTSVKSLKDAFELQAAFARSAMEKTMAESGKLTDASFKLTEQAMAPITARMTIAVESFSKAA